MGNLDTSPAPGGIGLFSSSRNTCPQKRMPWDSARVTALGHALLFADFIVNCASNFNLEKKDPLHIINLQNIALLLRIVCFSTTSKKNPPLSWGCVQIFFLRDSFSFRTLNGEEFSCFMLPVLVLPLKTTGSHIGILSALL